MPVAINDQVIPWEILRGVEGDLHGVPDSANDVGYLAWTYEPALASSTVVLASSTLTVCRVKVPTTLNVTNVLYDVTTAGATLTSGQNFVGIYNNSGQLVASSADQSTGWTSTGLKTTALTGGPFAVTGPYVYVAFQVIGTTGPTLAKTAAPSSNIPVNGSLTTGFLTRCFTATSGTTALPSTLASPSNGTAQLWVALS